MRSCRIEATRRFEGFVAAKRRIDPSPEASNATVFRQIADAHFPDTLRLAAGDPTLIVGAAGNCSEFSEFSAVLPVFRLKGANRHDFPLVAGIRVTPSDAGSAQFLFRALRQRFLDDCPSARETDKPAFRRSRLSKANPCPRECPAKI